MTIDLNDILRIVLHFIMPDSVVAQLVWHYLVTNGTGGDPATILTAIEGGLNVAFNFIEEDMSNQVESTEIDLLKWDTVNNRFDGIVSSAAVGVTGTNLNEMLPHGDAALVKLFTEVGRRQGRKFIPGYTEEAQDEGSLLGVAVTRLISFAGAFNNDVVSGGITLSPGNFNVEPASPLFETFAEWSNTSSISTIVAYQRRRKAGVGI